MTTHVLVGTSPADAARRSELSRLADALGAELAFLQMASPSLGDVLERLAGRGETRVVLVGVSGGLGGPGVSWLRRIASDWWRAYGDGAPEVRTAPAYLGEASEWNALVDLARPITHGGPGSHLRRVGGRARSTVTRSSSAAAPAAPRPAPSRPGRDWCSGLMGAGLGDDDVLVTQTGCQFPCNHAPVVTVQPDDVWYGQVDEAAAGEIVDQHLVAGAPVERLRLPRTRVPEAATFARSPARAAPPT